MTELEQIILDEHIYGCAYFKYENGNVIRIDPTTIRIEQLHKPVVMQGPLLWNTYPSVRPTEYGDYFVYRAGKIHKETWNNTGWAYNNNTVTHWLEISGPTVGKERGQGNKSDGFCYNWIGLNNVRCKEQCERCKPNGDLRGGSADGLPY